MPPPEEHQLSVMILFFINARVLAIQMPPPELNIPFRAEPDQVTAAIERLLQGGHG